MLLNSATYPSKQFGLYDSGRGFSRTECVDNDATNADQHPFLFFIPIMALFVGIQFLTNQQRKRGLPPQNWPKVALVVLLVALCLLLAFAKFR